MKLIYILIALMVAALIFLIADLAWIKQGDAFQAAVIAKAYSPAATSTSTGYAVGPKGEIMPTTSTSYKSEQWVVAFGGGISVNAHPSVYVMVEPGAICRLREVKGGISGWVRSYLIEEVISQ